MPGLRRIPSLPHIVHALLAAGLAAIAIHAPAVHAVAAPDKAAPQGTTAATGKAPSTKVAQGTRRGGHSGSAWNELSAEQQHALQPLAATWPTLSKGQKRKWIALSRNFRSLSPQEQATLHSRMTDWVALSPQQRVQARLNFGETQDLSADDKKAKWEAYQALPPEEKRRLAAGANPRTPPTAAAVRPVPAKRLADVPRGSRKSKPPRIATGPAADAPAPSSASPTPPSPVPASAPSQAD